MKTEGRERSKAHGFMWLAVSIICWSTALQSQAHTVILYRDNIDHDWTVHYQSQCFGLQQHTFRVVGGPFVQRHYTETYIYFGRFQANFKARAWLVTSIAAVLFAGFVWLLFLGFQSFGRRPAEHPGSNPRPSP